MDANSKLKRSADVTYQLVAEEAILIRLSTGTYFSLNKIGAEFWEMLDGTKSIGGHAAALAAKNNGIVQSAVEGLRGVAGKLSADFSVDAQPLVDELGAYADALNRKYTVDVSVVVDDLIEIASKMRADHLVEIVE